LETTHGRVLLITTDVKQQNVYSGMQENLGYKWLEEERLTPTSPGGINEIFK